MTEPEDRICPCDPLRPRPFEMLDEPAADELNWHVCPCCGVRKLLPSKSSVIEVAA